MSDHQHKIVCAAVRLADGRVICGVRHMDPLMRQSLPQDHDAMKGHEQGFVDNRYEFLTRREAWRVAVAAFQFDPEASNYSGIRGSLVSEDLW
jgi:hypothetical protein